MDLSRLESMSSEGLQAIRDKCVEVLAARRATSLRRGCIAWFLDGKGMKRTIRVERINTKTVSGREIDPITLQTLGGLGWRVTPSVLNMVGEPAPPKPASAHKPSTNATSAW